MNWLNANAPALMVVGPLLAGLATAVLGRGRRGWWIMALTSAALFGLALLLARQVLASPTGAVVYTMGPWAEPVRVPGVDRAIKTGIEYRVDGLNALLLLVITGIALVTAPFARLSVAKEIAADRLHLFYAVYLLCITGLVGMTITGDAFNVYVLLEISSLTSYALVAMGKGRDRRALTASYRYLVLGTVGASFILIAIGYLFMVTGTLNMGEMAAELARIGPNRTTQTAFALLVVGLGMKMALFPLHAWLPNAYTYAPSAVTALLASTATKVGVYAALRFFLTIFGVGVFHKSFASEAMLFLGCAGILHGSLMAIQQQELKRLLAWSSVAQIGYMVVGFCLAREGHPRGLEGTLMHIANHALVKGALFVAVGAVIYRTGSARVADLTGLMRRMPLTATAIVVAGMGLIGMPLTGGFISKWLLVGAALEGGRWGVAFSILLGSALAIVYVMRMVEPMVFGDPDEGPQVGAAPPGLILPAWVLCAGSVFLGVSGAGIRPLVERAAVALVGGTP
ncbi:MAG: monovalent cation/H+ antiporter subunit D family protein [Planctomycetota bacterium]